MTEILALVSDFLPLVATLVVCGLALFGADRLLIKKGNLNSHNRPPRQLVMILLTLFTIVAVILVLPLELSVRNELLGLLGIVLTGMIAFSSTTFIANMMAGLMLRSIKSFSPGDFIQAGEYFGKVTERGLFHTEIQSEDRDLITLPNLFLSTNPVKVVRASGTVLNCSLSLGYDIDHKKVEQLLKDAALSAGLSDPFVQIVELGDFSVTYKAAAFYSDVEHLLSTKSAFKAAILDALHSADIEIVSPAFMNQRVFPETRRFVPPVENRLDESINPAEIFPEALLFDKADKAKKIEMLVARKTDLVEELKALEKTPKEELPDKKARLQQLESQIRVSELLLDREKQAKENQ